MAGVSIAVDHSTVGASMVGIAADGHRTGTTCDDRRVRVELYARIDYETY